MGTARTVGGQAYLESMQEMYKELTRVIEDFMRAVDVESLRLAKTTLNLVKQSGKHASPRYDISFILTPVAPRRASRARTSRARAFA